MELTLFTNILNILWYIFTVLFLLYKFTSFFTYMYNFVKFCGRLFKGIFYLKDQVKLYFIKRNSYSISEVDLEAGLQPNTERPNVLSKIKHTFNILCNSENYMLKNEIPLIERSTLYSDGYAEQDSEADENEMELRGNASEDTEDIEFKEAVIKKFINQYKEKKKGKKLFNKHINKIMKESINSDEFNTVKELESNTVNDLDTITVNSNKFLQSDFIEKMYDKSKGDWLKTHTELKESFENYDDGDD